jgi:superoxide dismutase, Fe-Mn family
MTDIDRRTALAAPIFAAAALQGSDAMAQQTARPATAYEPRPLPYAAGAIPRLSDRLISSHWENNYGGAVRRLNSINTAFAALDPATAPGFTINGLKREELIAANSMILHELYFDSLASEPARPGRVLAQRIEADFGSEERWRAEFSAMGKALGGGSGWALLTWSPRLGRLVNQWAFDHTMTVADGHGLLALDMYEHAYHMDFGARAGEYVDAYMAAINWEGASRRFEAARRERT